MEPNELPDELANLRHINTYTAPSNYFDALAEDIIGKVYLPLLTDTPYSAPSSAYFDGLANSILEKLKNTSAQSEVQQELEEIEPLLTHVPKTNVYSVPSGYFESFTVTVPVVKEAATIRLKQQSRSWSSYAAAAVIAGVIAVSVIFFRRE